ncbi:hypothetical protein BT69DRAFT_1229861 [Atractiella rhizophila]|nr:hypothetical protein BT69DRAFT_1229861 [Atractiella rhizophila]
MELLGMDKAEFKKWTIKKQITTRSEKIVTNLNAAQALVVRDSVAKFIYACLFDWLVSIINESLTSPGLESRVASFIGVLDIYGFEHFKKNSFEQFCINYANEKLQQEFNAHVFKLEQEEYLAEKIEWKFIDFSDNQPTIDLIEGKLGVLSLLDEESRLPAGSDASFAQKLYQTLGKPENAKVFKKARFGSSAFTIAHYALDVTYETEGFLEKNKDTVPDEHMNLLQNTSNAFLKDVIDRAMNITNASKEPPPATPTVSEASRPMSPSTSSVTSKRTSIFDSPGGAPGSKKPTLGSIFKGSLISLMDTIELTNVHYIRCIKPNEAKRQWEFEPQMVLGQLRACGVLETIRISCAGYPTRWTFDEFAERYYMLVNSKYWGPEIRNLCSEVLKNAITDVDKYQVGLTKIFFRAGMLAFLENRRSDRLNYLVTLMQKNFLRHMYMKRWQNLRTTAIGLQATGRRILAQRKVEHMKKEKAAVEIQRAVRAYLSKQRFATALKTIKFVQSVARGIHIRATFRERRRINAAIDVQSMIRGLKARKAFQTDRKRIILIQSCVRRRQAKKELLALKTEAKSVSHFKEVSYKLENKVVELTQILQKRTNENKEMQTKIKNLEQQLQAWMDKFDEADSKAKALAENQKSTVALPEFEALQTQKSDLNSKLETSLKKLHDQDAQIQKLTEDFMKQTEEMENRQKLLNSALKTGTDDSATISQLRQELTSLREQLQKAVSINNATNKTVREGPPTFDLKTGKSQENGITNGLSAPKQRRTRRHSSAGVVYPSDPVPSFTPDRSYDDRFDNVRAVSVAFPQENSNKNRMAGGKTYLSEVYDDPSEEIIKLLEEEESLDEDVLGGIIRHLKIPSPSLQNPPSPKEVLFPAHLISLVTNEMWKYGLMRESERFLANVMQTIQQHVMAFQGEDAIVPGVFWLSNVHEILSFVCIAESDILQGIGPGVDGAGREFEWDDYERLVTIVKHDLDSLEYNIYHTWMQETKKKLHKMVIPALIESQSLPGFVTSDGGGRLFNRLLQGNSTPAFNMDDILNLLNRVWKSLKSYYVEHSVVQQVVTELLKLIGVTSFNDLLMRRNFNSWKRAMQIQYNITRLEEWCKSHDMPEGTLQLEYLMQATKLLQLKKATLADIEIIYDVCWLLSPSQIAKLVSGYFVADYENPISPDMLRAVASRVVPNDKNDHLLLPPEVEEAGPYEVPLPREVMGIETYVPAWLQVAHIRRLVQLVS